MRIIGDHFRRYAHALRFAIGLHGVFLIGLRYRGIRLFNAMPKHIRDLSCSVSSFKYQLDKYLGTIPDTPCIANYDNSLENSSHTNPHFLTGVHPV